jgi:hypothetical protein
VRKLLFAAAAGTAATLMAVTAFAQGATTGPSPEDLPPYAPDPWSHRQWSYDYSGSGGCWLVREHKLTPSGHVIFRTRQDCE